MSEMDRYYQILGLNPGASEEAVREAYRDLAKVWHPDRFSNDPRLKEKANEKLKEINLAYEILKVHIAGKREQYTTSEETRNHTRSEPHPHESPPRRQSDDAAIVVKRPSTWGFLLRSVIIYIDGKKAGKVGNGQSALFDVAAGNHAVHIRVDWMKTKPLVVNAWPGETVTLECRTDVRLAGLGRVESQISLQRLK
jgi:hypothetical protein